MFFFFKRLCPVNAFSGELPSRRRGFFVVEGFGNLGDGIWRRKARVYLVERIGNMANEVMMPKVAGTVVTPPVVVR